MITHCGWFCHKCMLGHTKKFMLNLADHKLHFFQSFSLISVCRPSILTFFFSDHLLCFCVCFLVFSLSSSYLCFDFLPLLLDSCLLLSSLDPSLPLYSFVWIDHWSVQVVSLSLHLGPLCLRCYQLNSDTMMLVIVQSLCYLTAVFWVKDFEDIKHFYTCIGTVSLRKQ